jgi:hypothetical protein
MKKAKFLQDAKLDPARYYRNPADVLRDRRLTDEDRRQIIAAWERNARSHDQSGSAPGTEEQLSRLRELRERLEPAFPLVETPEQGDATGAAIA